MKEGDLLKYVRGRRIVFFELGYISKDRKMVRPLEGTPVETLNVLPEYRKYLQASCDWLTKCHCLIMTIEDRSIYERLKTV